MSDDRSTNKRSLPGGGVTRRQVPLSANDIVTEQPLAPGRWFPRVVRPALDGVDLLAWLGQNRQHIQEKLQRDGAILFRGFDVSSVDKFEQVITAACGQALRYTERSSPRSEVKGNVYTSTDYPPAYRIFLHNENSYARTWPQKLLFCCITPSTERGETPIADTRRVYDRIDPKIRDRFIAKKVMYVRNFSPGLGLAWSTVFGTTDRGEVEAYCRTAGYETEWLDTERLRTRRVGQAVARHPKTGETTWFNHATFFHVSTLEPAVRDALLAQFEEDELPNNTYYGDGTPIEASVMDHLRDAYEQETVSFPWEQGDVLMLDNMITAHARAPFAGERKILVGMTDAMSIEQLQNLG
jgi:alpha-ketoglutarate-dependent taurine dioxygenase